ncbi:MAG: pantoate--beta-alanine ligase [Armatimonadota bacterium]
MRIFHKISEVREYISKARSDNKSIGLVPTMGYFHEGHLSLMRRACEDNDIVAVSLFVNPIQFGPAEDLRSYPRDLQRDADMAESIGVDFIFNPAPEEMYSDVFNTYVEVLGLTESLCGASRPGHFRGVATVVMKLFNIVQPDKAYFGQKDYQQLRVIERMVDDLNVPVEIIGMPTYREPDGLAMSSRNIYLNSDERKAALIINKSLSYAQTLLNQNVSSVDELGRRVVEFISTEPLAQIDYIQIVDANSLQSIDKIDNKALLAMAVKIGKTRLIDNAILTR